jgi:hypothetical protein
MYLMNMDVIVINDGVCKPFLVLLGIFALLFLRALVYDRGEGGQEERQVGVACSRCACLTRRGR